MEDPNLKTKLNSALVKFCQCRPMSMDEAKAVIEWYKSQTPSSYKPAFKLAAEAVVEHGEENLTGSATKRLQ